MRNSVREQRTLNIGIICDCIRICMRKKRWRQLQASCMQSFLVCSGFQRARAKDESRDKTKDDERRAPTWNRFRKLDAQRPLKHIPESKEVCGSERKDEKKETGLLLGPEKTQNNFSSIQFPSSPSRGLTLEKEEHVGWEQPRPQMGGESESFPVCLPRVESLRPHRKISQRPKGWWTTEGLPLGIFM